MKRALITGVSGQDGSYLAELLLEKGYAVSGVVRDIGGTSSLKNTDNIELIEGDVRDKEFVRDLVARKFDEIYNFASIATVQNPWEDPAGTVVSTALPPLHFLEAIRASSRGTRFFQASSAEMYGGATESPQSETTIFRPQSPYGSGKLLAHQMVGEYRSTFNLFALSGILFNHESPRRSAHFVTRKITSTLARIARGSDETLVLGNLDAKRDWSFAGDIVRGAWLSLQQSAPSTYVFASGEVHTVREFVEEAARVLGIELHFEGSGANEKAFDAAGKLIVEVNPDFYRPIEATVRRGDISHALRALGWKPETSFKALVEMMVNDDRARVS